MTDPRAETGTAFRLLAAWAMALATVQTGAILLSVSGLGVGPWAARGVLLAGIAAGAGTWRLFPGDRQAGERGGPLFFTSAAVACLAALFYAAFWAVAWLKPDLSWDANAAHIPVMHFWTVEGRIHWIEPASAEWQRYTVTAWNTVPKAAHAVMFVVLQATGLVQLLNAYNLLWLPLGVLGVYVLARALGATRNPARLAAALFIFVPVNVTQAPTCYVDAATGACFAAYAAVVARCFANVVNGQVPRLRDGLLLGALCGLTLGVKMTGIVMGPLGLLLVAGGGAFGAWRRGRLDGWRELARPLTAAGLMVLLVAGYWYGRNLVYTGNPIYPVGVDFGNGAALPGASLNEVLDRDSAVAMGTAEWSQPVRVLFTWVQGGARWPASIRLQDSRDGGLGYIWLLGGLPAAIALAFAVSSRRVRKRIGSAPPWTVFLPLASLVIVTFLLRPYNHWARHTVFLHVLGLPAWALAAQWAVERARAGDVALAAARVWVGVCVALALFEGAYCLGWTATRCYVGQPGWPAFDRAPVHAARSLTWHDPTGYLFTQLSGSLFEDVMLSNEPVTLGPPILDLSVLVGQLCQPPGKREILFPDRDALPTPAAAEAYLLERRVRYIILETEDPPAKWVNRWARRYERVGMKFHLIEVDPAKLRALVEGRR